MRLKMTAILLGLALSASVPAMAQTTTQQQQQQAAPLYNTSNTAPMYYTMTPTGAIPVYNNTNTTPTLPMKQMIAGKDAPSYQYNNQVQPYGTGNTGWYNGSGASMSPVQEAAIQQQMQMQQQQQQQAAASAQQQAYMNSLQQGQMPNVNQQNGGTPNLMQMANPFGVQQQPVPTKRRVVNKEFNNPLKEPQRLFNPDQ